MKPILGFSLALAAVFAAGCAPPKVTVYGAKGTPYTAPDLCAALLACKNANETSCWYNDVQETDSYPGPAPLTEKFRSVCREKK